VAGSSGLSCALLLGAAAGFATGALGLAARFGSCGRDVAGGTDVSAAGAADEAAAAASGGGAGGGAADVWVSPCGAASAGSAASCGVVAGWASGATTSGLSDSRCQTKSAPSKSAAPRAHESQRRED